MLLTGENETYVIASEFSGTLLRDGQPLTHTKIFRRLTWNGNEEGTEQQFETDANGHFTLPTHEETLALSALVQFTASAKVEAEIDGERYDVWYNSKLAPELYAETNGPLRQLVCDIHAEEIPVYLSNATIPNVLTCCRWENMPVED